MVFFSYSARMTELTQLENTYSLATGPEDTGLEITDRSGSLDEKNPVCVWPMEFVSSCAVQCCLSQHPL